MIDYNFVRVVLDKSVIPKDKVNIDLVGSDRETAIEEQVLILRQNIESLTHALARKYSVIFDQYLAFAI